MIIILRDQCFFKSTKDRAFIQMQMLINNIFFIIKMNNQQSAIFNRICLIKYIISSIHFVVKIMKYLESDIRILKKLLLNKSKDSILQQFYAHHNKQASMKIQINEFVFKN